MCVLQPRNISIRTGHISSSPWPHAASGYCICAENVTTAQVMTRDTPDTVGTLGSSLYVLRQPLPVSGWTTWCRVGTQAVSSKVLSAPLFFNLLNFWLCWAFVAVCGLSLVAASGGYSLVAVSGLLMTVASLGVELRL